MTVVRHPQGSIDRAIDMRERGKSIQAAANRAGLPRSVVAYHTVKAGVVSSKPRPPTKDHTRTRADGTKHIVRRFTPEEDTLLLKLRKEGKSLREIARTTDRMHHTIYQRLNTLAAREEHNYD